MHVDLDRVGMAVIQDILSLAPRRRRLPPSAPPPPASMLARLPPALRGVLTGLTLGLNTLVLTLCMVPPALLKLLVPARRRAPRLRPRAHRAGLGLGRDQQRLDRRGAPGALGRQGVESLHPRGWYLVSSNHQSWVDILVLQRIFHGHIPFLKFFLKQELIWVPVIGLAWWALDFPFMKRGKGQGARQSDLKSTREACEKFKRIPTSVINFVEGTRFTPAKHAKQASPYRHLLKPKIGGLGIALATMGEQFEALLDVTIVYPHGAPRFSRPAVRPHRRRDRARAAARDPARGAGQRPDRRQGLSPAHQRLGRAAVDREGPPDRRTAGRRRRQGRGALAREPAPWTSTTSPRSSRPSPIVVFAGQADDPASQTPHARALREALRGQRYSGTLQFLDIHTSGTLADLAQTRADLAIIALPPQDVAAALEIAGRMACRSAAGDLQRHRRRTGRRTEEDRAARRHQPARARTASASSARTCSSTPARPGRWPRPGSLALVSQSGALTSSMLDWASKNAVGFSAVVSLGPQHLGGHRPGARLPGQRRADAEHHRLPRGHLSARRFMSALRSAASAKPVVVLKAGRKPAGNSAAQTHSGAIVGSDDVFDAALRRAGAVRVRSFVELFSAAKCLASRYRPVGRRLAIVTNGGGPGVLAADWVNEIGLRARRAVARVGRRRWRPSCPRWPRCRA